MKISIVQPDLLWEDKYRNFASLGKMILPLYNKTDIVILPEMFNTGFSMSAERLSETPEGETFNWMKIIAQSGNFGLCGSYMVKENGNFFNRWVFVSPENIYCQYDKRHLFSMSGEDKFFTPGKTRVILSYRGTRICPSVCYDLRFPVWTRNKNDYDLLIFTANWPESRSEVWNTLLKARAIENQCYVAGANRIGTDGNGIKYCGNSMIINPRGEVIASVGINEETSVSADISLTELSHFRRKFPVLGDSDDYTIIL
ncbi:MAG: amidohydrolase [Bacteroidales bacterium]|nr:amidohydrolase [Bacteroidales bacterium]